MKKILLFLSLFLLIIPIYGNAIVSPTNEFYINDYANILSGETEEYILQRSLALHAADGTQIVVVTVPNLEGMSLEKYAYDLFNSFGIGDKEKNNGLLLLLALEERKFRVEVGDGLGGILPDGKTGRFQDNYIIPYLKENKWDEGIRNGYDAFYAEIVEQNNLDVDYTKPIDSYSTDSDGIPQEGINIIVSLWSGIFIGSIVRSLSKKTRKKAMLIIMIIWGILFVKSFLANDIFLLNLFIFLIMFLIALFGNGSSGRSGIYYGGSSGGRNSGGGFSGGGGRSSGGGSSRSF